MKIALKAERETNAVYTVFKISRKTQIYVPSNSCPKVIEKRKREITLENAISFIIFGKIFEANFFNEYQKIGGGYICTCKGIFISW